MMQRFTPWAGGHCSIGPHVPDELAGFRFFKQNRLPLFVDVPAETGRNAEEGPEVPLQFRRKVAFAVFVEPMGKFTFG